MHPISSLRSAMGLSYIIHTGHQFFGRSEKSGNLISQVVSWTSLFLHIFSWTAIEPYLHTNSLLTCREFRLSMALSISSVYVRLHFLPLVSKADFAKHCLNFKKSEIKDNCFIVATYLWVIWFQTWKLFSAHPEKSSLSDSVIFYGYLVQLKYWTSISLHEMINILPLSLFWCAVGGNCIRSIK